MSSVPFQLKSCWLLYLHDLFTKKTLKNTNITRILSKNIQENKTISENMKLDLGL